MVAQKGQIYLIKLCDTDKRTIYKIGRSKNFMKRLKNYNYYEIISIIKSTDTINDEREIIKIFNKNCKLDKGNEFYTSDRDENYVMNIFLNYFISNNTEKLKLIEFNQQLINKEFITDKFLKYENINLPINEYHNIKKFNVFGCESIKHITINNFNSFFKNAHNPDKILCKLSDILYKNEDNINFIINKNIISYINKNFEIITILLNEFIIIFIENLKLLLIELFYIYKKNLKYYKIIKYMKRYLLFNEIKQINNDIQTKIQIKSIIIYYSNKYEYNDINEGLNYIIQNNKLKSENLQNNLYRIQLQKKSLDDYNIDNIDNIDYNINTNDTSLYMFKLIALKEINLYNLKNKAFKENIKDKKKYKNIDEDYDENEEDNKDKIIKKRIEKLIEEENKKNETLELESKKNEILELKSKNNTIIKKKKIIIVTED